jgi:glycosyltransferase involved in cell wall biosynthesis
LLYSWQNLLRPRRFHVRQVVDYNLRAADHIVCASAEAVDVLRRKGYRQGSCVMPLVGVDTRLFTPAPQPDLRQSLALSGAVIGYVGRLVPEKGIDTLLHAFAQIPARGELLLVGDGPHESDLRALAHTLGIAARCRFVPTVSYDQVADYLNLMDVLVLPSRTTPHWKEQFGRVLVEAMGCGVTVVGSDSGAIPEVIGAAGFVFAEGDAAALAAILAQLTADPALRRTKATEGWQRVQAQYTVERIAHQLLGVWRSLLTDARVEGQ